MTDAVRAHYSQMDGAQNGAKQIVTFAQAKGVKPPNLKRKQHIAQLAPQQSAQEEVVN